MKQRNVPSIGRGVGARRIRGLNEKEHPKDNPEETVNAGRYPGEVDGEIGSGIGLRRKAG